MEMNLDFGNMFDSGDSGGDFNFDAGSNFDWGNYDFGLGDAADTALDTGGDYNWDSDQGFDLGKYIDFDDSNWDKSLDKEFSFSDPDTQAYIDSFNLDIPEYGDAKDTWDQSAETIAGQSMDKYFGTGDSADQTDTTPADQTAEGDTAAKLEQGGGTFGGAWNKYWSGKDTESQANAARTDLYGKVKPDDSFSKDVRDNLNGGGIYTDQNGTSWFRNMATGKIEKMEGDKPWYSDLFKNEGLLKMIGGMGQGALGFIGNDQKSSLEQKRMENDMALAREKMQMEKDLLGMKLNHRSGGGGRGGGGSTAQTASDAHNSGLANMTPYSRLGDFTKR